MRKKLLAALLLMAVAVMCLSGCKSNDNAVKNEAATLKWVFLGPGEQRDSEQVWAKFNEELSKYLPDVKVEFECIASAEYSEKWKLMSTSQEDVDVVWHGWMIPYVSEVKKGSYMELDGLVNKYAPEILNEIPEKFLAKQRVDGKLYSVPNMQQMVSFVSALCFPIDIYEKYQDKLNLEELNEFFASHKTMDKDVWNKLEEIIVMLKDGGDLREGVFGFANNVEKGYEWVENPYKVVEYDPDPTPVNLYRTPEFKTFVETYADWYQKGYIRKDVLTADNVSAWKDEGKYSMFCEDNFIVGQDMIPNGAEIKRLKETGKTPSVKIPFYKDHYIPFAPSATNTAISSNSKNPEKAMQLINLMNTNEGRELYNLLVYGIEGTHYKKINDIEVEPIGYVSQATSDSPYGLFKFAMGNTYNAYEIYVENKNKLLTNEFIKKVNDEANASVLQGFSLDTDPIKTELAQVNAVKGEFLKTLNSGAAPNVTELYRQFEEKLIKAGDDKVMTEIKRQIDEWMANQ